MKLFLRSLIIFLIPVFAEICFVEVLLRMIPNDYKYKRTQLLRDADNIQILVLGSSHAHFGIDPEYFSLDGFNLSNISQSLDLDYKLLKKYGEKLTRLEYVLLPASYFTMVSNLGTGDEQWRSKNWILYYFVRPAYSTFAIKNYFEIFNGTMLSNLTRIHSYFKNESEPITVSNKGFGLNYSSKIKNNLEETGNAAALRHTYFDMNVFDRNKKTVEKIIEWCEKRNVKLIFVTFPAYYTYKEKLDEYQLTETVNYMQFIDKNYKNVYYRNLFDEESFTEEYFFDADHLNELGAMKLTKTIDDIITNIGK